MLGRGGQRDGNPLDQMEKTATALWVGFLVDVSTMSSIFFNDFDFRSFWVTYGDFTNFHHLFPGFFLDSPG